MAMGQIQPTETAQTAGRNAGNLEVGLTQPPQGMLLSHLH